MKFGPPTRIKLVEYSNGRYASSFINYTSREDAENEYKRLKKEPHTVDVRVVQ